MFNTNLQIPPLNRENVTAGYFFLMAIIVLIGYILYPNIFSGLKLTLLAPFLYISVFGIIGCSFMLFCMFGHITEAKIWNIVFLLVIPVLASLWLVFFTDIDNKEIAIFLILINVVIDIAFLNKKILEGLSVDWTPILVFLFTVKFALMPEAKGGDLSYFSVAGHTLSIPPSSFIAAFLILFVYFLSFLLQDKKLRPKSLGYCFASLVIVGLSTFILNDYYVRAAFTCYILAGFVYYLVSGPYDENANKSILGKYAPLVPYIMLLII